MRTASSHFRTARFPARSACDESWGLDRTGRAQLARSRASKFAHHAGHCRRRGFAGGAAFAWAWACNNLWIARWPAPDCSTRFPCVRGRALPSGSRAAGGARPRDAADLAPPRALDDAARKEIAALPNVVEVNPEVRFTAEARREPNSQLVMVSGMAPSSQSSGTLDGLTGNFFSGPGCGRSHRAGRPGEASA